MIFNRLPFYGTSKEDLIDHIVNNKLKFPLKESGKIITNEVKDLITKMLNKDPHERISMIDIFEHQWFKMSEQEIEESTTPKHKEEESNIEEEKLEVRYYKS